MARGRRPQGVSAAHLASKRQKTMLSFFPQKVEPTAPIFGSETEAEAARKSAVSTPAKPSFNERNAAHTLLSFSVEPPTVHEVDSKSESDDVVEMAAPTGMDALMEAGYGSDSEETENASDVDEVLGMDQRLSACTAKKLHGMLTQKETRKRVQYTDAEKQFAVQTYEELGSWKSTVKALKDSAEAVDSKNGGG